MRLRIKILIAAPLIIILLAAVGITAGLAINSNIRQSRYNDVLDNGPGAERAIWKNDDGSIYLVSDGTADVSAYLRSADDFTRYDYKVRPGCFVVILDSAGDTYLEGRIRLKDGKLEISHIDCRNNTFTDDGNTIILKKFDYDELIQDLDLNFLS